MIAVSADKAYEIWAPTYDSEQNPLVALELRGLSPVLDKPRPRQVVDVGCGTGRWLQQFADKGCGVAGVDPSPAMLREAGNKPGLRGHLVAAHANLLPIRTESSDLILCSLSLGYFADLEQAFREFARVAKPGGIVIVSDLHPEGVAAGWTRSFRAAGVGYKIKSWVHPLSSIHYAAESARLELEGSLSLRFGTEELPIFQAAGKEDVFKALTVTPAIFVGVWRKPC